MNILITGSEGFFGTHLRKYLEEAGHIVNGWDVQNGEDIFDHDRIDFLISKHDVVVHLAAHTNVRYSFEYPEEVFRVNTIGAGLIQHLCWRHGVRMIFASSIATTDRESSPYAQSKGLAEDILKQFQDTTIFRFSNLIGPNMNDRSGALLYHFLRGVRTTGTIRIDGDGSHTRDFIHIRDVVDIVKTAIEQRWVGEVIDCVTGVETSIKTIADLFVEHAGVTIEYGEAKPGPKHLRGNSMRLHEIYKKQLTTNVAQDVRELIEAELAAI